MKKSILLFSTLSPYPFWAGSEKFWFDLVLDPRTREKFEFHIHLADSPVTREKAHVLRSAGASVEFYKHYNVEFLRRNFAKLRDRLTGTSVRRLPWYDEIGRSGWDLVWFNVDGMHNLREIEYAVAICKRRNVPYWIMLQHGYEEFCLSSREEMDIYGEIATSARRFVFIAKRNRRSLERALGLTLENALHSQNALTPSIFEKGLGITSDSPVGREGTARFFNLGRFSPKDKGQHLLLEALSGPEWAGRDWKLSFIGVSGFGEEYLYKLAGYFGIDRARVETVAFTEDVFAEIARHDVLLMPSLAEGTPFAMIESMACGRPAVGTPIGGIPELILDGETGWLAQTASVSDVAEAMERMWSARASWREMGDAARNHMAVQNNEDLVFAEILDALEIDSIR